MEEILDKSDDQPFAGMVTFGSLDDGYQFTMRSDDWEEIGSPESIKVVIEGA